MDYDIGVTVPSCRRSVDGENECGAWSAIFLRFMIILRIQRGHVRSSHEFRENSGGVLGRGTGRSALLALPRMSKV